MTQPVKPRFKAGTVILLVAIACIVGTVIVQRVRARNTPPTIERTVTGSSASRGIAPVPEYLLRHRRELALADAQVYAITDLAAAYRTEIQRPWLRLRKASATYQRYLEAQRAAKQVNAQALANAGFEVQRLSGVVAAARHAYWTKARAVLTPTQQRTADALTAHVKASDLE
jgi:hypothetical protein